MKLATYLTEGIKLCFKGAQRDYYMQNDDFLFLEEEEEDYPELPPLTDMR
jgi:hypothetical protein